MWHFCRASSTDELRAIADGAGGGGGLRVVPPEALGSALPLDSFYLVALEKVPRAEGE